MGFTSVLKATVAQWLLRDCLYDREFRSTFEDLMERNVFGQQTATQTLAPAIRDHIDQACSSDVDLNRRALAISLHGGTGTGKTYVSNFAEESLFKFYPHTYKFIGPRFSDPERVEEYKRHIASEIHIHLKQSPFTLFVFVDSHMFPPGTLDVLAGYLDSGLTNVNNIDYSKAIYILQSNLCDKSINVRLLQHLQTGAKRDEFGIDTAKAALADCLRKSPYGQSVLYRAGVVQHTPFLPLQRAEVLGCISVDLSKMKEKGVMAQKWKDLTWDKELEDWIADKIPMYDHFALSGCKQLVAQVQTFVKYQVNKLERQTIKCPLISTRTKCYRYEQSDLRILLRSDRACVVQLPTRQPTNGNRDKLPANNDIHPDDLPCINNNH